MNVGTNALASTLDLEWVINGDSNTLDFDIDYDLGTSYVDIDGDSNSVTFDGSGYQSGYFYLDQTGNGEHTTLHNHLRWLATGSSILMVTMVLCASYKTMAAQAPLLV